MREIRDLTFFTYDLAAAADFYESLFETAPVHRDSGMALLQLGELRIHLHVILEQGVEFENQPRTSSRLQHGSSAATHCLVGS